MAQNVYFCQVYFLLPHMMGHTFIKEEDSKDQLFMEYVTIYVT